MKMFDSEGSKGWVARLTRALQTGGAACWLACSTAIAQQAVPPSPGQILRDGAHPAEPSDERPGGRQHRGAGGPRSDPRVLAAALDRTRLSRHWKQCLRREGSARQFILNAPQITEVLRIAVGTLIAERPPHKTERARFGHSASTSGV
jgi:hypothetical protein